MEITHLPICPVTLLPIYSYTHTLIYVPIRHIFTTVESSLQIRPFMQNEPNFQDAQMNVNKVLTKDYENKSNWTLGENEPKTNPNEPNFKKAEMNVTSYITKGYENKPPNRAPKKRTQFSKRQNPMQTYLPQRIMKETRFWVRTKQTQFKPKQTQFPLFALRNRRHKCLYLLCLACFCPEVCRRRQSCEHQKNSTENCQLFHIK